MEQRGEEQIKIDWERVTRERDMDAGVGKK